MVAHELLPKMVRVPAGTFPMGTEKADEDAQPVHEVALDEYHIGAFEVTNAEYARFVAETRHRSPEIFELPLIVARGGREGERSFRQISATYVWVNGQPPDDRLDHPVTLVRWDDAVAYCHWLAGKTQLPLRLPTEAEWEYAARAAVAGAHYPSGESIDPDVANFLPDQTLKRFHGTKPVGSYPPNSLGLYDMAGNVWEWVSDWYSETYYASSPRRNPAGPPEGRFRIIRGGSWVVSDTTMLECSHRHAVPVDTYSYSIGFRIAY